MDANQFLSQAVSFHQSGNLNDARDLYEKALEVEPFNQDALHNLGVLMIQAGTPLKAIQYIKMAVSVNPSIAQFSLSLSEAYRQNNNPFLALAALQKFLLENKKTPEGVFEIKINECYQLLPRKINISEASLKYQGADDIIEFREQADYVKALRCLEGRLKKSPSNDSLIALKLHLLLLMKEVEKAKIFVAKLEKTRITSLPILVNVAKFYLAMQHVQKAFDIVSFVLQKDNSFSEAYIVAATCYQILGDSNKSFEAINSGISCRITYAEAWVTRAIFWLKNEQLHFALYDAKYAIILKPNLMQAWKVAGISAARLGLIDEAINLLRKFIETEPEDLDSLVLLGELLRQNKILDEAEQVLLNSIQLAPENATALMHIGSVYFDKNLDLVALDYFKQALSIRENYPEAWNNCALVQKKLGLLDQAENSLLRSIYLKPDFFQAYNNIGSVYKSQRKLNKALEAYQKACQLQPDYAAPYHNIGVLAADLGRYDTALIYSKKAVELDPNDCKARSNYAVQLAKHGAIDDSLNQVKIASENSGADLEVFGTQIFLEHYYEKSTKEKLFELVTEFGKKVGKPVRECKKEPGSILKVGFVSGDFKNHPVSFFFYDFLKSFVKLNVDVVLYSNTLVEDELSEKIFEQAHTHKIFNLPDCQVCELILSDEVDVLVDLSGHTKHNRMAVFSSRVAPIQMTWLGYFASTGVEAMDYIICDDSVLPSAQEKYFTEKPLRMPNSYLCFGLPDFSDVFPNELPLVKNKFITFGSFNTLAKINDGVKKVWAEIIKSVPGSVIFFKDKAFSVESAVIELKESFSALGVSPERIITCGPTSRIEHLKAYHQVDIGLDPFPYPGGTTTAEALWMGVPVVSLEGDSFLKNVGKSILTTVGYPEWCADSIDAYIKKAINLASNTEKLSRIRSELREQLEKSPLCNHEVFSKDFLEKLKEVSYGKTTL